MSKVEVDFDERATDPLEVALGLVAETRAVLRAAEQQAGALRRRVENIEVRAAEHARAVARHRAAQTAALVADSPLPENPPPPAIEPDRALAIVAAEHAAALKGVTVAAGKHRASVVQFVELHHAVRTARLRDAMLALAHSLSEFNASDKVLMAANMPQDTNPLFFSRLSVPILKGDERLQASPGLLIDGRSFFGKPERADDIREFRAQMERLLNEPLPF